MFVGTTPVEVKSVIKKILENKKRENVFVGCSGNFTVDRLASVMGFDVFSNDVSLYSRLIADILIGTKTQIEVKNDELRKVFDSWEDHRFKDFISVLFTLKVSQFSKRANDYQDQMWKIYIDNSESYYQKTIDKFLKNKVFDFKIVDFFYGDFVRHITQKKGKGIGILFPPTYKGGYEKLFQFVDDTFEYPKADYQIFDPKDAGELFGEFLNSDENIIYSDVEWPQLEAFLKARIVYPVKHDIFLYSSVRTEKKFYISQKKKLQAKSKILLDIDYQFSEQTEITIIPATPDEVNYYKFFFMSYKVDYSFGRGRGLIFLADGKIFGFAVFSQILSNENYCFLHSDFVVNSNQQKLSKLVLYLLKSEEIRELLIDWFKHYYQGLKTTVYTNKPVSMKYRGVFNLIRRDRGKLIYVGEFSGLRLQVNYKLWLKKILKRQTVS